MSVIVRNYSDFCIELLKAGFSGAVGGKDDGVFGLFRYGWGAEDESAFSWHTNDPETDPWLWRIRVLEERNDIAYSKLFFRKAGYITKEWYPYFLAARRNGESFDDAYANGTVSNQAKRIYSVLQDSGRLPVHDIKKSGGFSKEEKSQFDSALTELQMRMFITMCGQQQRISLKHGEYGWASTMFCLVEKFWLADVLEKSKKIKLKEAEDAITTQIYRLNPKANPKKIKSFIYG